LPKILSNIAKKLKEGVNQMQEAVAETLGLMVYFIVIKIGNIGLEGSIQGSPSDKIEQAQ
jgi:hypothetical protein